MRCGRLRHLVVERDGYLAGILSYRDLQDRALGWGPPEQPDAMPAPTSVPAVSEAMMASPYVIAPETDLSAAAARLTDLHVGCLPVVEREEAGPRLVGLVTEADLLRAAYRPR